METRDILPSIYEDLPECPAQKGGVLYSLPQFEEKYLEEHLIIFTSYQ
jgi:hypothetical protein